MAALPEADLGALDQGEDSLFFLSVPDRQENWTIVPAYRREIAG